MRGDGAPRWVFAGMGLATLAYLHLDCLDGKQARRTASASPLGQLFDHGCDALCVHLLLVGIAPTLDVGFVPWSYGGQLAVAGPWLAAHWEEYHCGEMLYGNGWWGVTEANYTLVALHFASAAFGPRMWSRLVVDVAPAWLVAAAEKGLAFLLEPYALFKGRRAGASAAGGIAAAAAAAAGRGSALVLKPLGPVLGRLGLPFPASSASSSSSSSLAIASAFLSSLRINDLLLACIGGCGVLQITTQLWRVYALDSGSRLPRAERGNKELGLRAATKHLAQLALVVLVGVVSMGERERICALFHMEILSGSKGRQKEGGGEWLAKIRKEKKKKLTKKRKKIQKLISHTGEPLRAPARSALHSRAAFAAFGLAYALEATKLIMDHMAKEPFEVVWWPLALLSAGGLHSAVSRRFPGSSPLLGVSPDAVVAFNLFVISAGYLHYVTSVISETCAFLGIRCLTIDVERARRAKEEAAAAEGRGGKAAASAATAATATSNGTAKRAATSDGGSRKATAPASSAASPPRRRRSSSRSRK